MLEAYRKLKLAIVLYQSNNTGGAWRSIVTYHRSADMNGDAVKLIDRQTRRSFRQAAAAAVAAPRLLFNSMDSFYRWEAIVICLLRRNAMVYLHETEYMLDRFQRTSSFRYRLVKRILRRNPVLAVSEQAARLYRERFGSELVHVVYECLPVAPDFSKAPDRNRICMVGTIDERKGASFFSRVADRAAEFGLPWDFSWIGSLGSREDLYLSKKVKWLGWQDNPRDFVRACDVFFLSSLDDPFPLSCLEAFQDLRRCVAYAGTGVSELLAEAPGCAVYSEYEVDAALEALRSALDEEPDASLQRSLSQRVEAPAFRERMAAIFGETEEPAPAAGLDAIEKGKRLPS